MVSLLTNQSAITALQNLSATNRSLQTTQNRIATGLRVEAASDDAAYWSIATTMQSDNKALSTVRDALSLGKAKLDVATAALTSTKDVVNEIKAKLVAARETGVDRTKVQDEISALQEQLRSISGSAVFSGQNWLSVDSSNASYNATKSIVASFTRDSSGAIDISTIDIDISANELFDSADQTGLLDKDRTQGGTTVSIIAMDISALTDSAADIAKLDEHIKIADDGLDDIISAGSEMGAAKTRVALQQNFIQKLSDSISTGVGALIDGDMNVESTRLQALQTQQQLGVQALSIANRSSEMILELFQQS